MDCDDPKLLLGHGSFEGQPCAICVLYFKGEEVLLLGNGYCHSKYMSIHAGVAISGPILSLTTDIMYISVFPGFWKWIPMICMQELLITASAASFDSLSV